MTARETLCVCEKGL